MRFQWLADADTKLPTLRWDSGEYDANVLPNGLVFDRGPSGTSPDRSAVGAAMLLDGLLEGPLEFPGRVSPLTAIAIERYLSPARVNIADIDAKPRRLPGGSNRVIITDGFASRVHRGLHAAREVQLIPLRSDEHSGALYGIDHIYVISNYYMLARGVAEHETDRLRLALGVLFAEDALADVLVLELRGAPSPEWVSRHREVLGAVNLGFEILTTSSR